MLAPISAKGARNDCENTDRLQLWRGIELEERGRWMRLPGNSLVGVEADRGRARLRFEP